MRRKKRGTERYNPSLKIGEYFAGSLLCSFGSSGEGGAPKSGSVAKRDRKSRGGAKVIGDWTIISVFYGCDEKWSRAYRGFRTQRRVVILRRFRVEGNGL